MEFSKLTYETTTRVIARVYSKRIQSNTVFLILRDCDSKLMQCVSDKKLLINKCENIPLESVVEILGKFKAAPFKIKSCNISDTEFHMTIINVISLNRIPPEESRIQLPELDRYYEFQTPDPIHFFDKKYGKNLIEPHLPNVLDNRFMSLRSYRNQAIFKLRSAVLNYVRSFLLSNGFLEVQTPKLLGVASESGAEVFKVEWFNKEPSDQKASSEQEGPTNNKNYVYLAQSPQLYKQYLINSDFRRVFEVGPVFRAENSHTSRHLCEFTGIDLEMMISNDYHEVTDVLYNLITYVLKKIYVEHFEKYREVTSEPYPQFSDYPFILTFKQGVKLLRKNNIQVKDLEDLSTENERKLGEIVKKTFGVDLFILDKYPRNIRPFYTMTDERDKKYSNSYDIIFRGVEILSGAQRIHDYEELMKSVKESANDPESMKFYLDSFKSGSYPHGGGGFGLDRFVKCLLNLPNIREAVLFPRDPERTSP